MTSLLRGGRRAADRGFQPGSLRRQLVVLSAAITMFAAVLLTLLVQLLLARTTASTVARVLEERTDAVVSSAAGASTDGSLVVPAASLDAGVAVYDADANLVAGSAPSSLAREYAELAAGQRVRTEEVGETALVRGEPFTLPDGISGVVVVTERLAPYEESAHYALLASALTGLVAVLASAALAAWVSRRVLAPVVAMAATAEDWSEHDLSRRFDLGPSVNEIGALGHTLDTLLDKVATAIRSEQRLTSELAHELRTPLTSVQGTADLMALRPDLDAEVREDVEEVRAGARRMAETISALLDLARSSSSGGQPGGCDLREVLDDVLTDVGPDRAKVTLDVPEGVRLGLPSALARRAIGPLVDNAVRVAERVDVSTAVGRGGCVAIVVDDDGAGVAASIRDRLFEPGQTSGSGSGLGLSLARRIARSAGGDVRLDDHEACTRFVVELPKG